jgi:glycosyltransferase involved in cell wall biosynthesis
VKIILVHCRYQQTGGEDIVFGQERRLLERAGHQVVVFDRSNEEANSYAGIKRLVLLQKAVWNGDTRREFAEVLRAEQPDLVHIHNTWIMISPSIYAACREVGVPVVQTLHNYRLLCPEGTLFRNGAICEECLQHTLWRSVRYGCYRNSRVSTAAMAMTLVVHRSRHTWERDVNCHIVLTEFARNKFLEGGLPAEKMFVKPNFVYPDPLLLAGNGNYARAGDGNYMLFAGRLSNEERVSTLLRAWKHLHDRIPLVIVGGGEYRDKLEQKAIAENLSMVVFKGSLPHDETLAAIRGARALIFSSEWYETFGLTMVEAFASRVPVICSRRGAMQEIVDDGRTGFHFAPGSAEDLAEKVDWAWNHPERMQLMGEEARREYESKYTAEQNYSRLMEIYRHAIAGPELKSRALSAEANADESSLGDCEVCTPRTSSPGCES